MPVQMTVVCGKPSGKTLRLHTGQYIVGRGPECHLRPNSEWVSRQHCLLTVGDDSISVRDLGSTNGTLVNGLRIVDETRLHDGDLMQLGSIAFRFVLEPAAETIAAGHTQAAPVDKPDIHVEISPDYRGKTFEFQVEESEQPT